MTQRFKRLSHSLYECKYHIVFECSAKVSVGSEGGLPSSLKPPAMEFAQGG